MNLRDCLLASLSELPGTREFHLHVLVSVPRKNSSLYIFAKPLPKIYLQEVLVLCSEQTNAEGGRVMVTAIEASVYHIPASSSLVLYIAKVDSTGQGIRPSPTVALVRTLLRYYANPVTRPIPTEQLWIHLFARAQGQYLFPNSSEYTGKRPLSDIKLCGWWKRVLTEVAEKVQTQVETLKMYYLFPGYSEHEASNALKYIPTSASDVTWIYGHPYSQTEIGLPCPRGREGRNLGMLVPSFEDDPKSRFLDEIGYNTGGEIRTPARKRARMDREEEGKEPLGELGKVTAEEYWERMSFRQECVSGAITGFFAVGMKSGVEGVEGEKKGEGEKEGEKEREREKEEGRGQVSRQMIQRVMTTLTSGGEYSTKLVAIGATEMVESTVKRLCSGGEYSEDIYGKATAKGGSVVGCCSGGGGGGGEEAVRTEGVRVLTARRKERKSR
ncbi:hypothetical protein APHAL10511_002567 [Amanita phalloides]|nr:hypothetical protein APHAL10511_002567 [Amanita phalloides]